MESLLSRQQAEIRELPPDEIVWEVPLPIIQEPEPEPVPEVEPQDSQMVYGRGMLKSERRTPESCLVLSGF